MFITMHYEVIIDLITENVMKAALFCLLVMLCFGFTRAIRGPKITDRLVAVNMISTLILVMLAIISFILEESYLIDICLIYAMISFLAVILLTRVFMGEFRKNQENQEGENSDN